MKKRKEMNKFLNPKSVAIIGASENTSKVGGILVKKLQEFKGKKIFVNPNREYIFNEKCYKNINDYPKKIDLAIIAIPKEILFPAIKDCIKKNIKNIILITAGFSETGDEQSEKKLLNLIRKNKINLLGPNCFGISIPSIKLDTTFANKKPSDGKIAFLSQSGALFSYVADIKKIGFSKFISLGNMANLSFEDFLPHLIKDKNTKKIILYIEKLKDGKKFVEICKKSKKEIIAVKVGSSTQGQKAAISHTGSLATDHLVYKGIFKQAKITQCETIEEAFKIKNTKRTIKKINSLIITNAGGAGGLLADELERSGIPLIQQPIDVLGTATSKEYETAIKSTKPNTQIFVVLTPQKMSEPEETAKMIVKYKKRNKFICLFLGNSSIKKATNILKKERISVYNTIT